MKKLLAIVVLGLLLSGNGYAKEIYLSCDSYRVVGHYKSGGVSDEPGGDDELDTTFKINTDKERIYEFNKFVNEFYERKDATWSEAYIQWKMDYGETVYFGKINRFESTFIQETIFIGGTNPRFKKLVSYYKCRVGKKKF